jgi:hypothetical protein
VEIYLHLRIRSGMVCHRNNLSYTYHAVSKPSQSVLYYTCKTDAQIQSYLRILKIVEGLNVSGPPFSSFAAAFTVVINSRLVL